jgi:hypothetical protein
MMITADCDLVLTTFLAATSGIMAVLMLGLHGGPTITSRVSLFHGLVGESVSRPIAWPAGFCPFPVFS